MYKNIADDINKYADESLFLDSVDISKVVTQENCYAVNQICNPLISDLNLNFFRYMRMYKDGSRITLTNHFNWTKFFYKRGYYKIAWFDKNPADLYKTSYLLWNEKVQTDDNIVGKDCREKFNMFHGLTIIKHEQFFCDFYDFTTIEQNYKINELYVGYPEIFYKFCLYFKEKAADLIREAEKERFLVKKNIKLLDFKQTGVDIKALLEKINIDKYYMDDETYLTETEVKIMSFYIKGLTSKDCAQILDISPRTVEMHLQNIKSKIGCKNSVELAYRFASFDFLQFFHK